MKTDEFLADLALLLVKHPQIRATNTPHDVLALHMVESLRLFEQTLIARAAHAFYRPGKVSKE